LKSVPSVSFIQKGIEREILQIRLDSLSFSLGFIQKGIERFLLQVGQFAQGQGFIQKGIES